ncbi:hypothetical protein SSX86_014726 [Deinandra increscens subsp. villosa]|uniref:Uncharacterized protein n=1 Tax=Deinandra increscens subsp. villosa TaxID=3103831 RepID=A0AAP0D6I0_9ASTR
MDTPLSSRTITRSQASSGGLKSRQRDTDGKHQEREKTALIDITNGSPIVGLAMGSLKTPSSRCSKKRMMVSNIMTPGSGETLLRGQVKTLLQKVEEEGVISKICFEPSPSIYKRFMNSPMAVLAPTPANTPQVYNFCTGNNNGFESFTVSPVAENFNFTQMLNEAIGESNQEKEDEKNVGNWILIISSFTYWPGLISHFEMFLTEHKEEDVVVVVDELCEGVSKISVKKDAGKHIRFVYDSEGELEGELSSSSSSSI